MEDRKSFLLRIDPKVLDAVRKWADDELRSLNGQIEYLLRKALQERGRLKPEGAGERPA
jgi:hypothetical protein